jgi:protein SCO1
MKKHHAAAVIAAIILAVIALLYAGRIMAARPDTKPLPADSVYHLPLVLTDHNGRAADWRVRRGKPQLVSMFYTSCRYICPLIVDSGKAIEHRLTPAERARIGILLISMDPARDTPAALKAIVDKRELDGSRWTLASPPGQDVRAVAGVLGIRYRALVLLDSDGRTLARTERMGGRPDPEFLAAVKRAVAK